VSGVLTEEQVLGRTSDEGDILAKERVLDGTSDEEMVLDRSGGQESDSVGVMEFEERCCVTSGLDVSLNQRVKYGFACGTCSGVPSYKV
jgi:hypothetical protein